MLGSVTPEGQVLLTFVLPDEPYRRWITSCWTKNPQPALMANKMVPVIMVMMNTTPQTT